MSSEPSAFAVAARNSASFSAAAISSIVPDPALASSQARKRTMAAPSRTWRGPRAGDLRRRSCAPWEGRPDRRRRPPCRRPRVIAVAIACGVVRGSRRTLALSRPRPESAASKRSGSSMSTSAASPARTALESLRPSMNSDGLPRSRQDRKGEGDRIVGDVGAPDVEGPGDGVGLAEHGCVDLLLGQRLLEPRDLGRGRPRRPRRPDAATPGRAAARAGRSRRGRSGSRQPRTSSAPVSSHAAASRLTSAIVISHGS